MDFNIIEPNFYVYTLDTNGAVNESCQDSSGDEINLATQWILPSLDMFNLWENLIYDSSIKENVSIGRFYCYFLILFILVTTICKFHDVTLG